MRTGTKITMAIVVWAICMVTFLVVGVALLCVWRPELSYLWNQVPAIVTALLGGGGLGLGVNEIRKALEWWATKKAEGGKNGADNSNKETLGKG